MGIQVYGYPLFGPTGTPQNYTAYKAHYGRIKRCPCRSPNTSTISSGGREAEVHQLSLDMATKQNSHHQDAVALWNLAMRGLKLITRNAGWFRGGPQPGYNLKKEMKGKTVQVTENTRKR